MVLHILQIQFYLLLHNHMDVVVLRILRFLHQLIFITKHDTCWICDTRGNVQHMHLLRCPVIHIMTHLWTRTHQTHIANEHVYQLWQLVKLIFADIIPRPSNAGVTPTNCDERPFVRPHSHRPKLEYSEILVVSTHTQLTIKNRPLRVQFYPYSKY